MNIIILILALIGIVAVLIILPLYLRAYSQYHQCQLEPNPLCWYDWVCNTIDSYVCPAQKTYGCGPGLSRDENYCTEDPTRPGCGCRIGDDGSLPASCMCAFNSLGDPASQDRQNGIQLCAGQHVPENAAPEPQY